MTMPHAVLTKFPPLRERKHPGLAALIGVVTGGIGLAIYFKSLRDLFPVEVAGGLVLLGSLTAGVEPLRVAQFVVPVVGGLYGFLRARSSNRRRAALISPAAAVGSARPRVQHDGDVLLVRGADAEQVGEVASAER